MSASNLQKAYLAFLKLYLLFGLVAGDSDLQKCGPSIATSGWTYPKGDIILEVGGTLEMYCILDPSKTNYTARDLIFKKADQLIDPKYVTVINDTTARLRIENMPLTNEMHYCKLQLRETITSRATFSSMEISSASESKEELVCLNSVAVGCKPKEVTDFGCVSYNWEVLNCTWHQPFNGIKTNYTVSYQIPKRPGRSQWFPCPVPEEGRCSWTNSSKPVYRSMFEYLTFLVEGTNKFGNTSQQFRIHHYAHIIPAAPTGLTAISKTSSSIQLQWSVGAMAFFEKGLGYKVKYTWSSSPSWNVTEYGQESVLKKDDIVKLNVTGLKYPNMAYDFRIYTKSSVAMGNDSWSLPASLVVKTKSCPPYRSPETDIGSFNNLLELPTNREVLVYWKRMQDEEHNGDDFRYDVTGFEEDREINLKPVSVTNSYAKFINLSFNSYRFYIRAANSEGSAPASTSVYVPRQHDVLREPVVFTKVDFGDGVYGLSWKLADTVSREIANFTIYWCESNREWPYQCDNIVKWIHLPASTTQYNATTNANVGYQFAISVNTANSSSGMTWAKCTVLPNVVNRIKSVWVGDVDSTYIDLKWKLDCSELVEGIKGYNITYCPVVVLDDDNKCHTPEKTLMVNGDVTTVHGNITDLTPFTMYKITVFIFTDRLSGPPSKPVYKTTKQGAPDVKDIKVEVYNITDTTAMIRWNPPSNSNGVIHHYAVFYNNEVIAVNDTSAQLTNLSSYSSYAIRVEACTAVCARTESINLHTKIGEPGEVVKPTTEKINSSQTKLKWNPPTMLAGPSPVYEVKIQYDGPDGNTTVESFETPETEATLKLPCRPDTPHSAYTFYIRAKNLDDTNPQKLRYYVGPWSSAYTVNCVHGGLTPTWKILLTVSLCLFFLSIFGFVGRNWVYRWQEMKKITVVLPPKFEPQCLPSEVKDLYPINVTSWSENNEADHLNIKVTDIDTDVDTDKETSQSAIKGYTS